MAAAVQFNGEHVCRMMLHPAFHEVLKSYCSGTDSGATARSQAEPSAMGTWAAPSAAAMSSAPGVGAPFTVPPPPTTLPPEVMLQQGLEAMQKALEQQLAAQRVQMDSIRDELNRMLASSNVHFARAPPSPMPCGTSKSRGQAESGQMSWEDYVKNLGGRDV